MRKLIVTFYLNDSTSHDVVLTGCNMQQAYDFGQQKARDFNAIRTQEMRPDRVKEVSIRFPIEYNGSILVRSH